MAHVPLAVVGVAVLTTLGVTALTVTVAVEDLVPPAPVQLSVYVGAVVRAGVV